jgi:hypothetical protein
MIDRIANVSFLGGWVVGFGGGLVGFWLEGRGAKKNSNLVAIDEASAPKKRGSY